MMAGEIMLIVNDRVKIPLDEFHFVFSRSSGPGGQNVNKVNSRATLRWQILQSPSLPGDVRQRFFQRYGNLVTKLGEVVISSQEYREQPQNIASCVEKLKSLLASVATAPRTRKKTKPTKASRQRRLEAKKRRSEVKARRGK